MTDRKLSASEEKLLVASVDIIGRTGAKNFEVGYLDDDQPDSWYAQAGYHGSKIISANHSGPVEAADALARKLVNGGKCTHCGKTVRLPNGTAFNKKYCYYFLVGGVKWTRGCSEI